MCKHDSDIIVISYIQSQLSKNWPEYKFYLCIHNTLDKSSILVVMKINETKEYHYDFDFKDIPDDPIQLYECIAGFIGEEILKIQNNE